VIRLLLISSLLVLTACQSSPRNAGVFYPQPGQGQYVRPDYLNAAPPPLITPTDDCRARLYQGLLGQSEGAIFVPGLPGSKRIIKPAYDEILDLGEEDPFGLPPSFIEVRDFLPGQTLYTSSVRTPGTLQANGDFDLNRLTIELDAEGFVREIRCG